MQTVLSALAARLALTFSTLIMMFAAIGAPSQAQQPSQDEAPSCTIPRWRIASDWDAGERLVPALISEFLRSRLNCQIVPSDLSWDSSVQKEDIDRVSGERIGWQELQIPVRDQGASPTSPRRFSVRIRRSARPAKIVAGQYADLLFTVQPLETARVGRLYDLGMSADTQVAIGLDPLMAVVSQRSPLMRMDIDEIVLRLTQDGAPAERIIVPSGLIEGGSLQRILDRLGKPRSDALARSNRAERFDTSRIVLTRMQGQGRRQAVEDQAAGDLAVGLVSSSIFRSTPRSGDRLRALPLGFCRVDFPADGPFVKTQEFPLSRTVYAAAARNIQYDGAYRDFLTFVRSDEGQAIVRAQGYTTLGGVEEFAPTSDYVRQKRAIITALPSASSGGPSGQTARDFLALTAGAAQLSRIIRFAFLANALNEDARDDVAAVAQYLDRNTRGRTVYILGFADSGGTEQTASGGRSIGNERIARERAEAVRTALQSALGSNSAVKRLEAHSFGAQVVFGCPEGNTRDPLSRRVEIWLK